MAFTAIISCFLVTLATFDVLSATALKYRHVGQAPPSSSSSSCSSLPGIPVGCWFEGSSVDGRLLRDAFLEDKQSMTVELCADFCTVQNNYALFGLEYGSQCFCANDIQPGSGFPVYDISLCNFACAGNSSETCGGYGAIDIYQALPPPPPLPPGLISNYTYTASGCYAEPANGSRALDGFVNANARQGSFTCSQICGLSNFQYFGLEYGDECWCGHNVSPLATLVDSSNCSMPCAGNAVNGVNETCGGPLLLELYIGTHIDRTRALGASRCDHPEPRLTSHINPDTGIPQVPLTSLASGL